MLHAIIGNFVLLEGYKKEKKTPNGSRMSTFKQSLKT